MRECGGVGPERECGRLLLRPCGPVPWSAGIEKSAMLSSPSEQRLFSVISYHWELHSCLRGEMPIDGKPERLDPRDEALDEREEADGRLGRTLLGISQTECDLKGSLSDGTCPKKREEEEEVVEEGKGVELRMVVLASRASNGGAGSAFGTGEGGRNGGSVKAAVVGPSSVSTSLPRWAYRMSLRAA